MRAWVVAASFGLGSCTVEIHGKVDEPGGAPVAGARLDAGVMCSAVSGADGTFATRCPRGDYHFVVTHPTHAASALHAEARSLVVEAGTVELRPWPSDPGFYVEPGFEALPEAPLVRRVADGDQRFCLGSEAVPTLPADARLFEVHDTDWRIFPVDAEGCALRLSVPAGGRYWSPAETRVEPASVAELAPGRQRVSLGLAPGRYVIVPWFDGFLVPDDPKPDTWLARPFAVAPASDPA